MRSKHSPPQLISDPEHVHVPATQLEPEAHAVVQSPQWAGSVITSTQAPPHASWPPGQAQVPFSQVVPAGQALPHVPQLVASDANVMQVDPPHCSQPDGAKLRIQPAMHSTWFSGSNASIGIRSPSHGSMPCVTFR
jgi:hypothetical protein